jgi:N6-adenosine-specific RNA methylase IME4
VINVDEPVLPDGPFDVVYADPPWRYGDGVVTSGVNRDGSHAGRVRSIDSHYPTMPLEDIHAMPIPDMASPDAVLFLWATTPLLRDALSTMEAWGFEYHDHFVWVKVKEEGKLPPEERAPRGTVIPGKMGLGVLVRRQHELLLVGFRGSPGNPVPQALHRSVVAAPYRGHSVKPHEFYDIIETMYPRASRVELFARAARPGWVAYGNQAPEADGGE